MTLIEALEMANDQQVIKRKTKYRIIKSCIATVSDNGKIRFVTAFWGSLIHLNDLKADNWELIE